MLNIAFVVTIPTSPLRKILLVATQSTIVLNNFILIIILHYIVSSVSEDKKRGELTCLMNQFQPFQSD